MGEKKRRAAAAAKVEAETGIPHPSKRNRGKPRMLTPRRPPEADVDTAPVPVPVSDEGLRQSKRKPPGHGKPGTPSLVEALAADFLREPPPEADGGSYGAHARDRWHGIYHPGVADGEYRVGDWLFAFAQGHFTGARLAPPEAASAGSDGSRG